MIHSLRPFVLIALCVFLPNASSAQLSDARIVSYADRLDAAAQSVQVSRFTHIETTRQELSRAIEDVRRLLNAGGNQTQGQGWIEYLLLDDVQQALAELGDYVVRPKSRTDYLKQLKRVQQASDALNLSIGRSTANFPGLERREIVHFRDAARRFRSLLRYRDPAVAARAMQSVLTKLAKEIRDASGDDGLATAKLDQLLRFLHETNQASGIAADLRSDFRQSNLRIGVGVRLVDQFASRPFSEPSAINECLLGTRIIGRATLTGHVNARLNNSRGSVAIDLLLNGNLDSQSRGYNFPVSVDAAGFGTVHATKRLYLDDSGIRAEPAVVTSNISSRIQRVNHPLKIVRKIARREADKRSGPANAEGARRLERKVGQNFDRQATQEFPLDGGGSQMEVLYGALRRFGLAKPQHRWDSCASYMLTTVRQASGFELAAATVAPPVYGKYDLVLQVHESIVNNAATRMFGDRKVSGSEIARLIKSIAPNMKIQRKANATYTFNPDCESDDQEASDDEQSLRKEPADPNKIEVTFTRTRPIIFETRGGKVRFGFRGRRFSDGVRDPLKEELLVVAEYAPLEIVGEGIRLRRTGPIEIDFPGNRANLRQIATRKALQCQFELAFPEELLDKAIQLPVKQLEGTQYRVRYFEASDGWLTVGLR